MNRYICIHGHFYQPPRENPGLEEIEPQESAYPFDNWNERISHECYEPNAAARILDEQGRIVQIVNNYARMSFNFGPTLISWLERRTPTVYEAILEADVLSQSYFNGHGSALAMPYNHMIMPLASSRDKRTQILWGIRDFERRFKRRPEGMWLPETAVDVESLSMMAAEGIRFTILAPHQAARTHAPGLHRWLEADGHELDTTTPYRCPLPGGGEIMIFFYERNISHAVAFEGLLRRGEDFAGRLLGAFPKKDDHPRLVHIATDGETFGHHHRFGEMALAYATQFIESSNEARITNYGCFLDVVGDHLPQVEIRENTSWSCVHGIERWRNDCGCKTGGDPAWHQKWRAPLREALDHLRDTVREPYEEHAGKLLKDPWAARDDYVELIEDRGDQTLNWFFEKHARRPLEHDETVTALKLLEIQRFAMYIYTSCAWFFDEISGIEAVQNLLYANRLIQLAEDVFRRPFEPEFLLWLEKAPSNLPNKSNGRFIYDEDVKPNRVTLLKVGAHFAVWSLFEPQQELAEIYAFRVHLSDYQNFGSGESRLATGNGRVVSCVTRESVGLSFAAFYLGGRNLNAGVRPFRGDEAYRDLAIESRKAFERGDFVEVIHILDRNFGDSTFSIASLFKSERRRVIGMVLESRLAEARVLYREVYERNIELIRFLAELKMPVPRGFEIAAEYIINVGLQECFRQPHLDIECISGLLESARRENVQLDAVTLSRDVEQALIRTAEILNDDPFNLKQLLTLIAAAYITGNLPFRVDLFRVQNICFQIRNRFYTEQLHRANEGDPHAERWVQAFRELGDRLRVRIG